MKCFSLMVSSQGLRFFLPQIGISDNCTLDFTPADCSWGDHVGDLESSFGVTGQRTPRGLQWHEFVQGLEAFKAKQVDRFEEIRNIVR